jgi:PAS domain S-box-containing protein
MDFMKDELYLKTILSSIQAGVIIIDVERHEIVDVNEAAAKLIGASKERIIGRICHKYVCPAEKGNCPVTDLKQDIDNSERTLIDINGKTIPIIKTVAPVMLGNRSYLLESFIDITDRKLAEESLRASQERFRALTESTSDWIWEVDQYGVYTYSSPKVKDLLGYEPNEIIGKSPFDLMPIDELQRISEIAHSIIESRMPFAALENTNLHKDGRRVILETSGVPIFDKDGNFSGYRGIDRDITERKKAEEEIMNHLSLLNSTIESTADGILVVDREWKIVRFNRKFVRMWNIPESIMESRDDEKVLSFVLDQLKDPESFLSKVKELYACPNEKSFDVIEFKDGRYFERYSQPQEIEGKILGRVWSFRDVTDKKKAKASLKASEEKYRLVVENASDAIFVAQDEMIKFPNPRLSLLTGYSSEELTSAPFRNFIHPEDSDMVVEMHKKRLEGHNVPSTYSFRAITKSGEILWVEVSKVLITWGGRPATLSFLRDITRQKKMEAQLLQAQKMEAIGQLAGGVAHDFNNLLTAIIGYGHLLKKEANQDDRMSSYVGHILSAAERAAILTNDLLTFSRKQIINPKPVNLNKIIKNMESLLLRVIGEDIELSAVLTDTDLTVMADSTQIDQILMNLATNAQHAMPKGGSLIIRTDRMELNGEYIKAYGYGSPGSYALLSVEDTGTGMVEDIMGRIFEPFFTTKEVGKGTGLGLAMVYGIVKQHDGYINVYSEPGRGTTFKILLPLIQSTVKEAKPDNLIKVKGGTETILIVEDDKQVRSLLKEILTNAGYNIIEAVDGDDAVEVFHKNKDNVHLFILDVIMPKKNGKEVYEEIKKVKSDMKVIFVSGYSADIIYKKGILEVGMNFISKPVSPDDLLTKVRNVLDA